VHCGQTVGRIEMKLDMQVGLGPGYIVLGGVPAPSPNGAQPSPIFGPYLLRSNGCMDQDVTWYGGRPRHRRLCVRWGPRCASPKGEQSSSPKIFGPCLLQPNGWMDEAGTWHVGIGLSPGDFVLDGDPVSFHQKGAEPPPQFRPISNVGKRLHASKCHLV